MDQKFDDIRPFTDAEIPAAMNRIAESSALPLLASYVCPEKPLDEVRAMLRSFKTIKDFQLGVMHHANEQIIENSITQFTYGGIEQLKTSSTISSSATTATSCSMPRYCRTSWLILVMRHPRSPSVQTS